MLVEQLTALNPGTNRDQMLKGRNFDANGLLESWGLSCCNIAELPETFGDVLCTGYLRLSYNKLRSLPPNFEQIRVGGDLYLGGNPELTDIPAEFLNVKRRVYRR